MDLRFTFLLLTMLALLALFVKPAHARNEYLQYDSHCERTALEPYVEYSQDTNRGAGSNINNGYDDDRATVGIRLRIPLTSTCTKQYRKTVDENALLRQQLELLKQCGRYKDLELGDEFALVREKCAGVNKKASAELRDKEAIKEEDKEIEERNKLFQNKDADSDDEEAWNDVDKDMNK